MTNSAMACPAPPSARGADGLARFLRDNNIVIIYTQEGPVVTADRA
ncbi:hypothetical protein [Saccharopolyspora sp. SCSIO 74807]